MKTPVLLVALLLVASCGDQVQKAAPPQKGPPQAAAPAQNPHVGHGAESRPAGGDPFSESGHAGKPAMAPSTPTDPERVVYAGEISIDPAVPLGAKYAVFITTTYSSTEKIPVLVKQYDTPKFPFQFELREKDMGMGARQSDRPLYINAMISDTGDAMKRRNRTTSEAAYPLYTKDIKLTIKADAPK